MPPFARRLVFLLLLALGAAGGAEPAVVKPGPVVLPITGLSLELPPDARPGFTWNLSGSYALTNEGFSYEARDVLDEKVRGALVAGTWIQVGYFDAGDCKATVASTQLADAWTDEQDFFGLRWCLRGGTYDLGGQLGKVPAIALCARQAGRKDLLLHRFILDRPQGATREDLLAAVATSAALKRIARAWALGASGAVKPRQRPEVRNRGGIEPVRTVRLARSGLSLTFPDDGRIWLVRRPQKDDTVDWIDLMGPALCEVSIEVALVPGMKCAAVLDSITTEKRYDAPPVNVPEGWTAGPTLVVGGSLERVLCRQVGQDALLVGLFTVPNQGPGGGDFAPLDPLLAALAAAAARR